MSKWRPENWAEVIPFSDTDFEAGADAMLEAVCEEIEKVENPYIRSNEENFVEGLINVGNKAFESCRQKILALLRSEKEEEK